MKKCDECGCKSKKLYKKMSIDKVYVKEEEICNKCANLKKK